MKAKADVYHWADQTALQIIQRRGDKERYHLASGITPSGTVHIGNFRELITVDLVKRALEDQGKQVSFLFFWDDYDVFRKVPSNLQGYSLERFLRKPLSQVPDPTGKTRSYAAHHMQALEDSLKKVGIQPQFIYQSDVYQKGRYTERIREALQKRRDIAALLNRHRSTPLEDNWYPVTIYCRHCACGDVQIEGYDNKYTLTYRCEACGWSGDVDFRKEPIVKLLWRVDWPMRWAEWEIDFEPGGKDHSSHGGSFDTASQLVKEVFGLPAPVYRMYDFITIKGQGGKMSSSQGNVIRLDDVLKTYEPMMVRYLFASYRPNVEFSIAFDLDVIKTFHAFDRLEAAYYTASSEALTKSQQKQRRIYELSLVEKSASKTVPFRPPFRHLCNLLQIHRFDRHALRKRYQDAMDSSRHPQKQRTFLLRVTCAENWIKDHAPPAFRFELNSTVMPISKITGLPKEERQRNAYLQAFEDLRDQLKALEQAETFTKEAIHRLLYQVIEQHDVGHAIFFAMIYQRLIGRDQGPHLAGFMHVLGAEAVLALI